MARPTLVTGGTGFAGSHLIDQLLTQGHAVAAWSNPHGVPHPASDGAVRWKAVDLLDSREVSAALAELSPSRIFHFAGIADVSLASADPARALRVNALGTRRLLDAVAELRLDCPVLVTSSALVYRPSPGALTEESEVAPANPYGFSKLAQEMVALRETRVRVLVARPFNHAGPRQSTSYVTSAFARQIAEIEAGRREPVIHVGNLESRRDITDVRDTIAAYSRMMEQGAPGRPYNVCCGRAYRIGDLLNLLLGMSRVDIAVREDPRRMRATDIPVVLGDPGRLQRETGWATRIPIETTLRDLLEFWRRQLAA